MNNYDPNDVQVIISGGVESIILEPCEKPYTYQVLPENVKLVLDTMEEMGADKVYTSPTGYAYLESVGFDMSKVGINNEHNS